MTASNGGAQKFFVVGTDTGIGKTIFSLLLMHYWHKQGVSCFYVKPVQTGCPDPRALGSDARFIYDHLPALAGRDPQDSVIYCFANPKAPYFAAHDEGTRIDLRTIGDFTRRIASTTSCILLEGAGGLLVPVTEDTLMVDMIGMLDAKPILVAKAGLGTINHTLLSLEAMYTRGIEPAGVAFMDSGETPTPVEMIRENIEAVKRHSHTKVAGTIGRIGDFSYPSGNWEETVARIVGDK